MARELNGCRSSTHDALFLWSAIWYASRRSQRGTRGEDRGPAGRTGFDDHGRDRLLVLRDTSSSLSGARDERARQSRWYRARVALGVAGSVRQALILPIYEHKAAPLADQRRQRNRRCRSWRRRRGDSGSRSARRPLTISPPRGVVQLDGGRLNRRISMRPRSEATV